MPRRKKEQQEEPKPTAQIVPLNAMNKTKLLKDALAAADRIDDRIATIKGLQQQNQADRDTIDAAGIPKKAFDHARRLRKMDPEARDAWDLGFQLARSALGVPVGQLEMFGDDARISDANDDDDGPLPNNGLTDEAADRIVQDARDRVANA